MFTEDLLVYVPSDRKEALKGREHHVSMRAVVSKFFLAKEYIGGKIGFHVQLRRIAAIHDRQPNKKCAWFNVLDATDFDMLDSMCIWSDGAPCVGAGMSLQDEFVLVKVVEFLKLKKGMIFRVPSVVRLQLVKFCPFCQAQAGNPFITITNESNSVVGYVIDRESMIVSDFDMLPVEQCADNVIKRTSEVVKDLSDNHADFGRDWLEGLKAEDYVAGFRLVISPESVTVAEISRDSGLYVNQLMFDPPQLFHTSV